MSADRLAFLVDAYAEAKAAEAAAAERSKDLRDQLLEESVTSLEQRDHDAPLIGSRYLVRVSTSKGHRLDTSRMKREQPAIYAAFSVETSSTRLTVTDRAQA